MEIRHQTKTLSELCIKNTKKIYIYIYICMYLSITLNLKFQTSVKNNTNSPKTFLNQSNVVCKFT